MANPTTRAGKGAQLTYDELDANFTRAGYGFRTPQNSGFSVTTDGTGDNTNALNSFASLCKSSGDPGMIPPGVYRTTAPFVIPAGAQVQGAGIRQTRIQPSAATFRAVRVAGSGLANADDHGGVVGNFGVRGPDGAPARNGMAALVLDAAPQTTVLPFLGENYDICLDSIANSYNCTVWGLRTDRRGERNVNCAINMRIGSTSGGDFLFYDTQVAGLVTALCAAGQGGGYRFRGGSIGTNGTLSAADAQKFGVYSFGRDYATDTVVQGVGLVELQDIHTEGWRSRYLIVSDGANEFCFNRGGITPSASTAGEQALGIILARSMQNSRFLFRGPFLGGGPCYFASTEIANFAGNNDDFYMEEEWGSAAMTLGGTAVPRNWLKTIGEYSNYKNLPGQSGFYRYADGAAGGAHVQGMGRYRLRTAADGTRVFSINNGATWAAA